MLLELNNIKKYFEIKKVFASKSSSVVRAVDDVSLTITQKENIGLVGESGCGKSTLARIVLQLMKSDSGTVRFEGEKITKKSLKQFRLDVQMVFQDPFSSLDPRFTVRNIMREAMTLDKHRYKTEGDKEMRIAELLEAVDLKGDMLNRYPHEFSGGERQRIAIARALVMNPKLLILDEAVSSLDVIVQEQILKLLKDLQDKFHLTYFFITHNLKVARRVCQKIAVMYKGRIIELAPTETIFTNPLHPYTRELLSAAIDYKSIKRDGDLKISEKTRLTDRGGGHFVVGEWY